jgi:hypothetical protein
MPLFVSIGLKQTRAVGDLRIKVVENVRLVTDKVAQPVVGVGVNEAFSNPFGGLDPVA